MKKAILFGAVILMFTEGIDCQWYQKYFNVNDPDLLSPGQVNTALEKSKENIRTGITLIVIGSAGLISGAYILLKDYPDDEYPEQAEMGKKVGGVFLMLGSVTPEIIGFSILRKNRFRQSEIKEYINSKMDIGIGFIIPVGEKAYTGLVTDFIPALSVTLRF